MFFLHHTCVRIFLDPLLQSLFLNILLRALSLTAKKANVIRQNKAKQDANPKTQIRSEIIGNEIDTIDSTITKNSKNRPNDGF